VGTSGREAGEKKERNLSASHKQEFFSWPVCQMRMRDLNGLNLILK
jgi:hypothetical protein